MLWNFNFFFFFLTNFERVLVSHQSLVLFHWYNIVSFFVSLYWQSFNIFKSKFNSFFLKFSFFLDISWYKLSFLNFGFENPITNSISFLLVCYSIILLFLLFIVICIISKCASQFKQNKNELLRLLSFVFVGHKQFILSLLSKKKLNNFLFK